MALEIWILLSLAAAAALLGVIVRLRRSRVPSRQEAERNVYPLW